MPDPENHAVKGLGIASQLGFAKSLGTSGDLEDEEKVPRTYEYPKEMFPLESVCALAAVERKRETKPNTVNLRMAEQSLLSLSQELRFLTNWHCTSAYLQPFEFVDNSVGLVTSRQSRGTSHRSL